MILAKIISNRQISENIYLLTLERKIDFLPGQVISLSINNIPPRYYSIASGTDDDFIDILYTVKKEGVLTPQLIKLKKDDKISYSPARGTFLNAQKKAVWIATGTGIAPFISMARSDKNFQNYLGGLYHGTTLDFHYGSDFFAQTLTHKYFRFSSQKENISPQIIKGRVTDRIKAQENLDKSADYYLCGKAEMVVEVRDLLIQKGIPFSAIKSEIYF